MQLLIGHGQVPTIMPEASKILELMAKASFYDEAVEYTQEGIASKIGISASTFSKFKTGSTNINKKNLKKIVDAILICLSTEENLPVDEMKERLSELLFSIFRREDVKMIVEQFEILSEIDKDDLEKRLVLALSHGMLVEKIFGKFKMIQKPVDYEDYENRFVDSGIIVEEMEPYINYEILFDDYRLDDNSRIHVAIFDVKRIDREYLHQRIRCLQRKDNVFAVLMVEKGACNDSIDFYQDEHSNIMLIEYEEDCKGNPEDSTYNYLKGICSSWYDEKCKAFMMEGINKIFVSHNVLVNNCVGFGLSPFYGTQKVIAYDYPMKCEAIIT